MVHAIHAVWGNVEGRICFKEMGECTTPADCQERCRASQVGGQGTCEPHDNPQRCTCYWFCKMN